MTLTRRSSLWPLAALVLALVCAAAAVAAFVGFGGKEGGGETKEGRPTDVSPAHLREFARSAPHAVFWAGSSPGFTLELTRTQRGDVFVRYLPKGVEVGSRKPLYTTIGTYPMRDAYGVARTAASKPDATQREAPGGGIAAWRRGRPQTVYLAYPGTGVLVEVYAATPSQARRLALSGRVGPIR